MGVGTKRATPREGLTRVKHGGWEEVLSRVKLIESRLLLRPGEQYERPVKVGSL